MKSTCAQSSKDRTLKQLFLGLYYSGSKHRPVQWPERNVTQLIGGKQLRIHVAQAFWSEEPKLTWSGETIFFKAVSSENELVVTVLLFTTSR